MKNHLFLLMAFVLVTAGVTPVAGSAAFKNFTASKNLAMKHKGDWFDYMKDIHADKYDLQKKHVNEWNSLTNYELKELHRAQTSQDKDKVFEDFADHAMSLKKKQEQEWEDLCQKNHKKALDLQKSHEKETTALELSKPN